MELAIAFAAIVLFVYSAKWRKFVFITAAVLSVAIGALCTVAYYDSHRQLTVDDILGPNISDLPAPPKPWESDPVINSSKDEYAEFKDAPKSHATHP